MIFEIFRKRIEFVWVITYIFKFGANLTIYYIANMDIGISEPHQPLASNKDLTWRRNSPYLYQLLYITELDWPSLTI